jgi:hypothetical protein
VRFESDVLGCGLNVDAISPRSHFCMQRVYGATLIWLIDGDICFDSVASCVAKVIASTFRSKSISRFNLIGIGR